MSNGQAREASARRQKTAKKTFKKAAKTTAKKATKRAPAASFAAPPAPALSFSGNSVMAGGRRLMTMAPGLQNFISSSPALTKATEELSENVTVTVAPKTLSKERVQDQRGRLADQNIDQFRPDPDAMKLAAERLKQLGFEIRARGPLRHHGVGACASHQRRAQGSARATGSAAAHCHSAPRRLSRRTFAEPRPERSFRRADGVADRTVDGERAHRRFHFRPAAAFLRAERNRTAAQLAWL